jgi:hypothetical protein
VSRLLPLAYRQSSIDGLALFHREDLTGIRRNAEPRMRVYRIATNALAPFVHHGDCGLSLG